MRILGLSLNNFRAITRLELRDLQDTVVVAGPNGCGKSCVFDAIRLLKSVYGGYSPNEWQNWFGEFQITFNQRETNWLVLFQNRNRSLDLVVDFSLAPEEIAFIRENARKLLEGQIWRELVPELANWRYLGMTPLATNLRVHEPEVRRRTDEALPGLEADLMNSAHQGRLSISPSGHAESAPSRLLELVFSEYDPQNLGIIDYHGANRNYGREQIGGISLNIESSEERLRQHALYNYANKYANLKTEMAGGFVRHLLAKEAASDNLPDQSLSETLKELFATFFPGKEFLGPRPTKDGGMQFPVRTPSGAEHDIDELSAGEKEVLYGYLRLRNAAPHRSVLLIDEPELHLNPRLVSGLASFYHRHLGRALSNQLWLVTHSDTLIREAVGQSGFSVFHLQPPGLFEGPNQASPVSAGRDVERLVIELVGDLAAYRPGAKIVIFEGGGDSQFDVTMTCTLFPEFQSRVNPISAGNKRRVADLYDLLDRLTAAHQLPGRFFAVSDSDSDPHEATAIPTRFSWDAYHIENYLLEPRFLLAALKDALSSKCAFSTEAEVLNALMAAARLTIPGLIAHRLRQVANRALLDSLDLSFDPSRTDSAAALAEAVARSKARLDVAASTIASRDHLGSLEASFRRDAEAQLSDGTWSLRFRGRDVLKRFVGEHGHGIQYEILRNLVLAKMRDADFQPLGMRNIVNGILTASAFG